MIWYNPDMSDILSALAIKYNEQREQIEKKELDI